MKFEKDYLEDCQDETPVEDIWLNDYLQNEKRFLIEFINESFYCNGGKVTHEIMIDKLDFYREVIDGFKDWKKEHIQPLTIPIFNMNIDINLLQETIDKFNL